MGKGNKPNACHVFENEEMDVLFNETDTFGVGNPEQLQRTVWWKTACHFDHRARDESRKLEWGDNQKVCDKVSGRQMLVSNIERGSKTRNGAPMGHTTKDLSCLLTKLLSTIKDGLVRYCNTKTSRNGVNNMWILKNSTSLLSSLDQLDVRTAKLVQTFDFSTLYTSIPHDLLKSRISNLVHNAFRKKDGSVRYTHIKLTRAKGYFTHDINGGGDNMFTADNICEMIEFLIDNIFVQFGGRLFRQVIGIPMGTNCAPLLADLFLYSYENEFLDNMIRSGHRRLARSFNLCYRYIDDLIVFKNNKFLDYLKEIYPSQLTVEKANKSDHLADYLDLTFIIDSGGKLSTRLCDKRDDFDFHIVNFPFLSSNNTIWPFLWCVHFAAHKICTMLLTL